MADGDLIGGLRALGRSSRDGQPWQEVLDKAAARQEAEAERQEFIKEYEQEGE